MFFNTISIIIYILLYLYGMIVNKGYMIDFLYLGLFFFIIGISGIFLFKNNVIFILICLELLSLSISIWISFFSIYLDNLFGQTLIFYILLTAAIEVSFGLVLVVILFFNLKNI